ncbi:NADH-quinone oxidoreductase subunit A [bacterium]|nr:NADH-quinone oxidoreductase subunit A [bacterium]
MQEFLGLTIIFVLSVLFALCMLVCAFIVRPKDNNRIKKSVYECGMFPFGTAKIRFHIQYFIFAILFLIFDVETLLLFPFAVVFDELGLFAFLEAAIFIVILTFGLFYAIRKGLLRWN